MPQLGRHRAVLWTKVFWLECTLQISIYLRDNFLVVAIVICTFLRNTAWCGGLCFLSSKFVIPSLSCCFRGRWTVSFSCQVQRIEINLSFMFLIHPFLRGKKKKLLKKVSILFLLQLTRFTIYCYSRSYWRLCVISSLSFILLPFHLIIWLHYDIASCA